MLFTALSCIRATASTLSILVMGAVLLKLKFQVDEKNTFASDARLAAFKRRQRAFTRVMQLSCTATFCESIQIRSFTKFSPLKLIDVKSDSTASAGIELTRTNQALVL
ncbi:unnamed protein product [Anisakis simplex]|uniref:Secreted protein n=1 Tax=Anisakis simplex TaxID=6269 RepID=A0A0M3JJ64_ANISI|nr:unnamed protein product [Anisakis simplex]